MDFRSLARRRAVLVLGGLACSAAWPARGQSRYPDRPIKFVVPFPAGGALDSVARSLSEPLQRKLGQPVVIENRPGAGARLATEAVARTAGDGYTILIATPAPVTVAPALVSALSYAPLEDLMPVIKLSEIINVMVVPDERSLKTVPDFIAWARKQNRPITFGSSGVGSADHLAGEFFKQTTGLDLLHVPYKGGGPAMADLATARIDVSFATYAAASSILATGKIRAIAVTTPARTTLLPDLPTIGESVKGFGVSNWAGIFVPKGTPQPIRERLFEAFTGVSKLPEVRTLQNRAGIEVTPSKSIEEFSSDLREETVRWARIIKEAGIRVE